MVAQEPSDVKQFNIEEAYNEIAGAAFLFENEGHLEIWIYLKDNSLQFHYVQVPCIDDYLVAHYKCHKVTHGFSSFEWNKLGRKLARIYFASK